jgi:hypothetical protein
VLITDFTRYPDLSTRRRRYMTKEMASELIGEVVSWKSSQAKYFIPPRQVRKFGEDLSVSDYQEAAKTHSDHRQHEKFKAVAQWMKEQGAKDETRLSALL